MERGGRGYMQGQVGGRGGEDNDKDRVRGVRDEG